MTEPHPLALLRKPSAFIPLLMSLAALAVVVIHVARFGTAQQADEGATAHLWQLLMAGQVPIVGYFAMKWLPHSVTQVLPVLAIQLAAAFAAAAPVLYYEW